MKLKNDGFTLVEIMVVVAIVGILSVIAIPAYSDYVVRAKIQEATSLLSDMRVRLEQYYFDTQRYGATATSVGQDCGVPTPGSPTAKYFDYQCELGNVIAKGAQSYVVKAVGKASEGLGGFEYRINEKAEKTTVLPQKWGGVTVQCWAQKKGGAC